MKLLTPLNVLVTSVALVGATTWCLTSVPDKPRLGTGPATTPALARPALPPGLTLPSEGPTHAPEQARQGTAPGADLAGEPESMMPAEPTAPVVGHYQVTIAETLQHLARVEGSPLNALELTSRGWRPWAGSPSAKVLAAEAGEMNKTLVQAQSECASVPDVPAGTLVATSTGLGGTALPMNFEGDDDYVHYKTLTVNQPGQKVFLVLTAYEPTAWRINPVGSTVIAGVFASGYHKQAVLGVNPSKVRYASYIGSNNCDYLQSERLTSRTLGKLGVLADQVIKLIPDTAPVLSSTMPAPSLMNFIDPRWPGSGAAGMAALEAMGYVSEDQSALGAYRLVKPFVWPIGLFGGNSVTVTVSAGQERPSGDPGHSLVIERR